MSQSSLGNGISVLQSDQVIFSTGTTTDGSPLLITDDIASLAVTHGDAGSDNYVKLVVPGGSAIAGTLNIDYNLVSSTTDVATTSSLDITTVIEMTSSPITTTAIASTSGVVTTIPTEPEITSSLISTVEMTTTPPDQGMT